MPKAAILSHFDLPQPQKTNFAGRLLYSVNTKLIMGFSLPLMIAIATTLAAEGEIFGASRTAQWSIILLGAMVDMLVILAMARMIAVPLRQVTLDTVALALQANKLDMIATAQRKLESNMETMRALLYGHGNPERRGDKLCFGDFVVNGTYDIVDKVQAEHGGSATIFLDDLRISTNIKDKTGARVIGTRLAAGTAFDSALKQGKSYRGEAEIFGEIYITIYEPIVADPDIIGIIFAAVKKNDVVGAVTQMTAPTHIDDIGQLAISLRQLREATVDKDGVIREAMDHRIAVADARRRSDALGRSVVAAAQREVVDALSIALEKLADADLTHRIDTAFPREYQKLKDDFGAAVHALQGTMREIMAETSSIRDNSATIADAVGELSHRTEQQAANLEETAASLDQITTTVKRTARDVDEARNVVANTQTNAEQSSEIMGRAVGAMSAIKTSSLQIGQIVGVIDEIALQTNLLALNAGVEAARAGEAGRGFAVLATEVRSLAQRCGEAAKEIRGVIQTATHQVTDGVELVGETGRRLDQIISGVGEVNGIVAHIATSARDQAMSLEEINTVIRQMDRMTQQNAAMVEESTAASRHLVQQAGTLETLVGRFKTATVAPSVRRVETGRTVGRAAAGR